MKDKQMSKFEALKQHMKNAFIAGFEASGEGYNGEHFFGDFDDFINSRFEEWWVDDKKKKDV